MVVGNGGFLRDSCGGYNESARSFSLYFDGQLVGSIGCYVNRCQVKLMIPPDAAPGFHTISVEGGASIEVEVVGN